MTPEQLRYETLCKLYPAYATHYRIYQQTVAARSHYSRMMDSYGTDRKCMTRSTYYFALSNYHRCNVTINKILPILAAYEGRYPKW